MVTLVLMGGFKIPDTNWEYRTDVMSKAVKFLKQAEDNFWSQILSESMRKTALLNMLFENRKTLWKR